MNTQQRKKWLREKGIDATPGLANLDSILDRANPADVSAFLQHLGIHLENVSAPDRALNNLERLLAQRPDSPTLINNLLDTRQQFHLSSLLILFSDSQFISDFLVRDHDSLETLRTTSATLLSREVLVNDIMAQLVGIESSSEAMTVIGRFKQINIARIACCDLFHGFRIEKIVEQISLLAESICEGALHWARQRLTRKWGTPLTPDGRPSRFTIIAMGKLGGSELNYSSDIDLVMVYDEDGLTGPLPFSETPFANHGDAPSQLKHPHQHATHTNREFYEQLTRDFLRLLSEPTCHGPAYRVDLRLRPHGSKGKICASTKSILHYYDFQGRTWERQALIKARPVAGDLSLGQQLLKQLEPWIYHQRLTRADIAGIKALKRKIERRAIARGESSTNIKTGHGGIRDIEFVIQFLQLLNGGTLETIRSPGTLKAIQRLATVGCLTAAEATLLTENYVWLRKLEHRLQLMFDLQTHSVPSDIQRLQTTSRRMGYTGSAGLKNFQTHLASVTGSNRTILDHLLHGAFGMTFGSLRDSGGHLAFPHDQDVPAEVDLILEPNPDTDMIQGALLPFGFKNTQRAFENLRELSNEKTPFLSSRRCHHFLSAISSTLLAAIATTPDPDATLVSLVTVSDSLGSKGVLWELFSFNPPTLNLYVRLCAFSGYLSGILKSNPGMIDELMDALQVKKLPDFTFLQSSLRELTRGAQDIEPIVYSFKNAQHLRVGIRDLMGRDEIQHTHQTLSDIAEVCLQEVAQHEYLKLLHKRTGSMPGSKSETPPTSEMECPFVILALGKLGGREPNYHSDLDVVFLYENNSQLETRFQPGVTSQSFFSQLASNITQFMTHSAKFGRMYEIDSRLRPTGKSGPLAVSLPEFTRYFSAGKSGKGQLWERQALCKSRPVFGTARLKEVTIGLVQAAIQGVTWNQNMASEISTMRTSMESAGDAINLKRGVGGTVDVEFAIQSLQLKYARDYPSVLVPGTLEAIERLVEPGLLSSPVGRQLAQNYQFLRSIESRLRLINTTARHDFPSDKLTVKQLAVLMNTSPERLRETVRKILGSNRTRYNEILSAQLP